MSKMLIFTAPSGAGKTTIVRHLLNTFPVLSFSVSATTRKQRPHEQDGYDYHFITKNDFIKRIDTGGFVEWEEVYEGLYYGTLHSEVDRLWTAGKHIIFDIEVKGATTIKKAYPEESLVVFVKPPSEEVLFSRLRERNTESPDSLAKRIARAAEELTYENSFDYVLLNDDLDTALAEAEQVTRDFLNL
ncbi:guanylate kinase [Lewinella cohaerens]|uniref:guanylate kinase n=1 Tax=Lewinella cohaerens TaxID=70995 RepID=UPI000367F9E4|nr:guanylate kinase [Lewinella cohaerens]